ncbi:hypothetical protein HHL16_13240 [Pseudoflavitalea sp. G-6-1-2]|uniref:hypothetical protein n=1 Tax=Pseudoflavitalea sp. G-6-1-2 TaxID=2728841 RepID=UPI00146EFA63|nr:hypothetical protein [Pseudoflavitalea sp. G-6-1-2]NML21849.1 hypothetical protein [Pseudoflavitalea sp. G-6-1-2]
MTKNKAIAFILIFGTIFCAFFFWGKNKKNKINRNKVYVVAKIQSLNNLTNSTIYYCLYRFKNKEYTMKFKDFGGREIGKLVFVKISEVDPELNLVLFHESVPDCIDFDKAPAEGWKTLPDCK